MLRSFISSSPFQYLKLLSRCCSNSGRSTKAGEKEGSVRSFDSLNLEVHAKEQAFRRERGSEKAFAES